MRHKVIFNGMLGWRSEIRNEDERYWWARWCGWETLRTVHIAQWEALIWVYHTQGLSPICIPSITVERETTVATLRHTQPTQCRPNVCNTATAVPLRQWKVPCTRVAVAATTATRWHRHTWTLHRRQVVHASLRELLWHPFPWTSPHTQQFCSRVQTSTSRDRTGHRNRTQTFHARGSVCQWCRWYRL